MIDWENKEESFYRDLRRKEKEISNLKQIAGFLLLLAVFVTGTTVGDIYSHYFDWIGFIIRLVVYFGIAFVIGEINIRNEGDDVIGGLFICSLLVLVYVGHFINVYLYLTTLAVLLMGYFAGHFYKKITTDSDEIDADY